MSQDASLARTDATKAQGLQPLGFDRAGPRQAHSLAGRDFARILIIKPSALGDIIHTVPLLPKLRARYPHARIDWFVTPENAPLVRSHPDLSNVVLFERRKFGRSLGATFGIFKLLFVLWRTRYDLVIDMHGQARSALFCLATGAPVRLGFIRAREGARVAYTHLVPVPDVEVHAVDRYLTILEPLGIDTAAPDFRLYTPPAAEKRIASLVETASLAGRPFALVVPGTVWQTKHWSIAGFTAVARHLAARGLAIVIAGSPNDRARAEEVARGCPGAVNMAGQTNLAEFVALVRRAAICVTNDSGSMHVATALDRPVVSAFGPTSPVRTGPYRRPEAVVKLDVSCSPCFYRRLSQCPHDHRCMRDLTVEMMIERVDGVLRSAGLVRSTAG